MSRKTVNIDTLLADDSLELIIKGNSYIIEDVEMSTFLMTSQADESDGGILIDQLSKILGVPREEIADIGLKTAAKTLTEIRNWVMDTAYGDEVAPQENP